VAEDLTRRAEDTLQEEDIKMGNALSLQHFLSLSCRIDEDVFAVSPVVILTGDAILRGDIPSPGDGDTHGYSVHIPLIDKGKKTHIGY